MSTKPSTYVYAVIDPKFGSNVQGVFSTYLKAREWLTEYNKIPRYSNMFLTADICIPYIVQYPLDPKETTENRSYLKLTPDRKFEKKSPATPHRYTANNNGC